ncbi:MAG: hypothetical protein GF405_03890 [Candidatus Eisenbacteria bacterium]|nr:hypothetical protein [Candidatus Eisenbacteria bacterium]
MRRMLPVVVLLAVLVAFGAATSKTYNSPNVNGRVQTQAGDWEADELVFNDPNDDCRYYPSDADLDNLWVTWDADSLYVGIKTVNGPGGYGNGYLLFIDTDWQNGVTGATDFTSADFYARQLVFEGFGAEVVMGGWNLPVTFDAKFCSDPTSTTDLTEFYSQCNPGLKHIEARFSWNELYGIGPGQVPPGTTVQFIAAVVGGDGSGPYDLMPTSSSALETSGGTAWNALITADEAVEIVVDANSDGVPDEGYPPSGAISGTVTLDEPSDTTTVVTVSAMQGGNVVGSDESPAGGGDYMISTLADGTYDVTTFAEGYLDSTVLGVVVANEDTTENVDFMLTRVDGKIIGSVTAVGGPLEDVTVTAYDVDTGEVGGDGAQVVENGSGTFEIGIVVDGTYRVEATAKGYVEAVTTVTVEDESTEDVGQLTLNVVEATEYAFVDSVGNTIQSVRTTVSLPADTIYYFAPAWIQPRDADGRVAYWDDAAQDSVLLEATKLDPSYPPEGNFVVASADSVLTTEPWYITDDMFEDGAAPFLVASDEVEVIRLEAARDTIRGVLEVAIDPAAPTRLALSSDVSAIAAGGSEAARITGQLRDASGNDAPVGGIRANLFTSGVGGQFTVSAPETDPNGTFEVDFSGTVAGTTYVSATIDPASGLAGVEVDTLAIVIEPGDAAIVSTSLDPPALRAGDSGVITAQVVDDYGNAVAESGLEIALTAAPAGLLTSIESPITTDPAGTATSAITAGTSYGVAEVTGTTPTLNVQKLFVPVDATIVAVDETAPESDPDHNSLPGVDLTVMRSANSADTLIVTLDFTSDWTGMHLGLLIETSGTSDGGATDPFGFPVNFAHDLLPDYCYTYKYAANDYGDLRRWNAQWEHYDFVEEEWRIGFAEGVNAVALGLQTKTADQAILQVPLSIIEADIGDTVRLQAYSMQEDGEKRTALDSTPSDATHDMIPDSGEWWETATTPVMLSNYATYVVRAEGLAPGLANGEANPPVAEPGDVVTYTAEVTDLGGGIGDVFLDLSSLGGDELTRMYDDGFNPDQGAMDGVYTAADTVGLSATGGEQTVTVTARDSLNIYSSQLDIDLEIDNPPVALRSFADSLDDDHGPNQTDGSGNPIDGLYYFYPTNLVFFPGSFDLTNVDIFVDGNMLVFRVSIDDLVNHRDAGTADWGAPQPSEQTCDSEFRTDLNLQKIDIYIDAVEGQGATSGFPNRYIDIASVDAWDYGISVEGWGKWFIDSNGSNSQASWTLYKNDSDVSMCNNYQEDYIDIRVNADLFGGDTGVDFANVAFWDIIVTIASHDGDSNDQNVGGIRWVNANTSEWQIGGGRDSEANRDRDPNIMDLVVSPGEGHEPGRTQEEMLDYTTDAAEERFENNQVACVVEASFAVDTSPPIISPFPADPELGHIPWLALDGAPAVISTEITDVTGIDAARLHWYPVGQTALRESIDMVNLASDVWAADIPRDDVVANTNVSTLNKTGDARVLEGWVYAKDAADSANAIRTSTLTFGIPEPWAAYQTLSVVDTLADTDERDLVFADGTVLSLEGANLPGAGDTVDFTLTPVAESLVDIENIRDDMAFLGVARTLEASTDGRSTVELSGEPTLTLHYPQYEVGGLDESDFGIFSWIPETERWVLLGGGASPTSNTVASRIRGLGLYGVFYWEALDVGGSEGLSGVMAEPNPFSPNGDGLYDEMVVSFFLGREADYVNVEFYDLSGRLARRLVFQEATEYTGRTPAQIVWDGTDENGEVVPYGIYVMRIEARFDTEPTFERVNRPVVVIK